MTKEQALKNYVFNTCLSWKMENKYLVGEHLAAKLITNLVDQGKTVDKIFERLGSVILDVTCSEIEKGKSDMAKSCRNLIQEMANKNFFEDWAEEIKGDEE